jgi:hypothetical protein
VYVVGRVLVIITFPKVPTILIESLAVTEYIPGKRLINLGDG